MKKFIYIFTLIALIFNACTKDFFLVDSLETDVKKTETISEDNSNKNNSSENGSNENTSQQNNPATENGGQENSSSRENNPEPKSFINVYQDSIYVYTLNPGLLYPLFKSAVTGKETNDEWGKEVWENITGVKIDGIIDARDFSTLKWNFRKLQNLDISEAKIVDYTGLYGTVEGYEHEYFQECIPEGAFFYWISNDLREFPNELYDEGMASLKSVKLSKSVKRIERNAFARAYNLEYINIPDSVNFIGMCSFRHCHSLKEIHVPKSIAMISTYAFTDMNSLNEVHFKTQKPPYVIDSFGFYYDGTNNDIFEESASIRGCLQPDKYLKYEKATLYVPKGYKDNYEEIKKYFKEIVEE